MRLVSRARYNLGERTSAHIQRALCPEGCVIVCLRVCHHCAPPPALPNSVIPEAADPESFGAARRRANSACTPRGFGDGSHATSAARSVDELDAESARLAMSVFFRGLWYSAYVAAPGASCASSTVSKSRVDAAASMRPTGAGLSRCHRACGP